MIISLVQNNYQAVSMNEAFTQFTVDIDNIINEYQIDCVLCEISGTSVTDSKAEKLRVLITNITQSIRQLCARFVNWITEKLRELTVKIAKSSVGDIKEARKYIEDNKDSITKYLDSTKIKNNLALADMNYAEELFKSAAYISNAPNGNEYSKNYNKKVSVDTTSGVPYAFFKYKINEKYNNFIVQYGNLSPMLNDIQSNFKDYVKVAKNQATNISGKIENYYKNDLSRDAKDRSNMRVESTKNIIYIYRDYLKLLQHMIIEKCKVIANVLKVK